MDCGISERKNEERFTWIDSLKGIAICAVVWVHTGGGGLGNLFDPLGQAGAHWVEMFFILTAYLACRSLKNKPDCSFLGWFLQRLWKLTPLYYFMLLLYVVVVPSGANIWLGTSMEKPSGMNILMHVLYLHSFFPYYVNSIMWVEWYLGVMVVYMAALPVLCNYIRHRKDAIRWTIVFTVISFVVTFLLSLYNPLKDEYIWTGWVYTYSFVLHIPSLAVGILLYYLEDLQIKRRNSHIICGISILGYIAFSYLSAWGENIPFVQIAIIPGYAFLFLIFILGIRISGNAVFHNRMWQIIGRNSYGIYLLHFLLVYLCAYFIGDETGTRLFGSSILWQTIKFLFFMLVCLCFSVLFNKIIGERIYKWGKRKLSAYFV